MVDDKSVRVSEGFFSLAHKFVIVLERIWKSSSPMVLDFGFALGYCAIFISCGLYSVSVSTVSKSNSYSRFLTTFVSFVGKMHWHILPYGLFHYCF